MALCNAWCGRRGRHSLVMLPGCQVVRNSRCCLNQNRQVREIGIAATPATVCKAITISFMLLLACFAFDGSDTNGHSDVWRNSTGNSPCLLLTRPSCCAPFSLKSSCPNKAYIFITHTHNTHPIKPTYCNPADAPHPSPCHMFDGASLVSAQPSAQPRRPETRSAVAFIVTNPPACHLGSWRSSRRCLVASTRPRLPGCPRCPGIASARCWRRLHAWPGAGVVPCCESRRGHRLALAGCRTPPPAVAWRWALLAAPRRPAAAAGAPPSARVSPPWRAPAPPCSPPAVRGLPPPPVPPAPAARPAADAAVPAAGRKIAARCAAAAARPAFAAAIMYRQRQQQSRPAPQP